VVVGASLSRSCIVGLEIGTGRLPLLVEPGLAKMPLPKACGVIAVCPQVFRDRELLFIDQATIENAFNPVGTSEKMSPR
jgi:hypothetical protein